MKRHSTDVVSLVFGLVFIGIAGWWVVQPYIAIDIPNLGWITAGVLILLGLLGVVASLRGERPTPANQVAEPAPASVADESDSPGDET